MSEKKKSKVNTIILLVMIILAMYLIFKLAIPIIDRAKESKEQLNEHNKQTNEQVEKLIQ